MPTDTALALIKAYKEKRARNPGAGRRTLFKYLLWDRFEGRMIMDSELDEMAAQSSNLYELTLKVVERERPALASPATRPALEKELLRFFQLNAPDQLPQSPTA
ncbi:hypothetical protein [Paucidesulfovibrio longus]|uniref:hypothetical protein n=1 Tax=Paucidesulfovibrio longus TaxID=889 RepID=UPI0003B65195|nr:hypothetical protein [Paucidesulfovibrio longus]